MDHDVVIVGASFAGLSAAVQLGRARRSVLVLDTNTPRNRFANTSHGFPGHDGQAPQAIKDRLQGELTAYDTVTMRPTKAIRVSQTETGFDVGLADARSVKTRRLILAYGVSDLLPDLPGLSERWGVSVLHCPYCHGYELNRQPIGVLATGEAGFHQAMLLPDWGPTTLFTQGKLALDEDQRKALLARGVRIEDTLIVGLTGAAPALEAVSLADGREIPLSGLFTASRTIPACDLADQLGCAWNEGPTGPYLAIDRVGTTSVPGVFAAGDLASPMPNATLAAAAGVLAASAAHRSLIFGPDLLSAA